ncbi:hypothetical protein C4K38_3239 [Pseudomonas chlororaphis subsp. piscium]|uniref:DUF4123 domain-containing protein n=1 Tax=Pseudomonas chlororaphis TaxID=587753 RepID=UPI0006A5E746|nr:DUF4123 domain-containing protein [Pseudomonas chlororaphis]AZC31199.1 hypothetical protein C4K38_3239 [Pseudomonas chlororaphis subsp. piscium]WDG88998.1 DUF4123 domain-containing protein [Pseudomonas chlororaphis]SDS98309.1 protein of unknown function [Pseudomonas chlororaphis]
MTRISPQQWMIEQRRLGCSVCLILDSEGETDIRQALLNNRDADQYCSVYSETPVADLANAGPFIFLIDNPEDRRLNELLKVPERNWGWLASVAPKAGRNELVRHWRERLIVGIRPHQALYRFHDNRVLSRALGHLAAGALPEYLGPVISVCYWQGEHWQARANPAPGNYPVPKNPAWCNVPAEGDQSAHLREVNARRYLLAQHLDAYARIAEQQDPDLWLSTHLALADAWSWQSPEQLEFLLVQSLKETDGTLAARWQAHPDETPAAHFQRVYQATQFWQGDAS